jgi:hypothetical protein
LSTFRHSAVGLAALAREGSLGTRVAEHVRSTSGGGAGPSERPQPWKGDDRFDVLVADSPMEMETILRLKHDEGFSAPKAAGFCWPRSGAAMGRDVAGTLY